MPVISQCAYTKIAFDFICEKPDENVDYCIALTWLQAVNILKMLLATPERRNTVFFCHKEC